MLKKLISPSSSPSPLNNQRIRGAPAELAGAPKNLLCCPVFLPQITGEDKPEEPVITKESVHSPPLTSSVEEGPCVTKDSKSKRTVQTLAEHL